MRSAMESEGGGTSPLLDRLLYTDGCDMSELISRDFVSQIYHSPIYLSRLKSKDLCSFSHWITTIVVVDFDLNEGHRLAEEYPPGVLSNDEKERLIRMSLPDSNSLSDAKLNLHVTTSKNDAQTSPQYLSYQGTLQSNNNGYDRAEELHSENVVNGSIPQYVNEKLIRNSDSISCYSTNWLSFRLRHDSCLSLYHSSISDQRFSIGIATFHSVVDTSYRRHTKQESVVVLTPLPISYFLPLLLPLGTFIANEYFKYGPSVIYDACASIGSWPMPSPIHPVSLSLNISMSNSSFHLYLPSQTLSIDLPQLPYLKPRVNPKSPASEMAKILRLNSKRLKRKRFQHFPLGFPNNSYFETRNNTFHDSKHLKNALISNSQSSSSTATKCSSASFDINYRIQSNHRRSSSGSSNFYDNDLQPQLWTPHSIIALWSFFRPTKSPSISSSNSNQVQSSSFIQTLLNEQIPLISQTINSSSSHPNPISSPDLILNDNQNDSTNNFNDFYDSDEIESVLSSLSSLFALDPSPLHSSITHRSSSFASSCPSHEPFSPQSSEPSLIQQPLVQNLFQSSLPMVPLISPIDVPETSETPRQQFRHLSSELPFDSSSPMEGVSWDNCLGPGHQEIIPRRSQFIPPKSHQPPTQGDSVPIKESKHVLRLSETWTPDEVQKEPPPHFRKRISRKDRTNRRTVPSRLGYLRNVLRQLLTERMGHHYQQCPKSLSPLTNLHLPPSPHPNLISCLGSISLCLWSLWEIMIIGSPLLILTSNSTRASSIVLSLLSLIHPLQYGGDFRPYVNSFDPDLLHYRKLLQTSDPLGSPSILIGASDPLLLSVFSSCPNLAVVEAPKSLFAPNVAPALPPLAGLRNLPTFQQIPQTPFGPPSFAFRHDSTPYPRSGSRFTQTRTSWVKLSIEGSVPRNAKLSKRINDLFFPPVPDFATFIGNLGQIKTQLGIGGTSSYTNITSSSESITEELEISISTHFHDLTTKFLKPFDIYLQPDLRYLMRNPLQEVRQPAGFVPESFLETIGGSSAPVLPPFCDLPRTKLASLYCNFISTRTFHIWFREAQAAHRALTKKTQLSYCAAINPLSLFPKLSLSEAAEGCAHLRHLLDECESTSPLNEITKVRLLAVELKKFVSSSFASLCHKSHRSIPRQQSLSNYSTSSLSDNHQHSTQLEFHFDHKTTARSCISDSDEQEYHSAAESESCLDG